MKKYNTKVSFKDSRGEITDLLQREQIHAVTHISFNKGAVRGNHYHKKTVQWTYVIKGKLLVRTKKPKGNIKNNIMHTGNLFVDEPLEEHAFKALSKTTIIVFTRGPRGGKEYETDTYRLDRQLFK